MRERLYLCLSGGIGERDKYNKSVLVFYVNSKTPIKLSQADRHISDYSICDLKFAVFNHWKPIMARFILFVLLLLLFYLILYYLIKDMAVRRKKWSREPEPEELVEDPYCQTYVPKRTAVRKRIKGENYYFCSKECLRKFLEKRKS